MRDSYTETTVGKVIIRRYQNAKGTNLADQEQPVLNVYHAGRWNLMGRWTTLCLPGTAVLATEATDKQIAYALTHDESVF